MARCEKCGNIVPDGQTVCPICGARMSSNTNNSYTNGGYTNQQYNSQQYNNQQYGNQGYGSQTYTNQNQGYTNQPNYQNGPQTGNTDDYTYMYDPMDIANNKAMAVLSYLGILCLIPLFANHTSRYARFHTAQGINLFIINIAVSILLRVSRVVGHIFLLSTVSWLINVVIFILMILGIVNAVNGRAKELPIVGKIHIINLF